ncbi:PTS sugar transporter subunit IIA [Vulgatibacter sp.]|uniref:PTS sugar transporter subunit IIA n=1 Tax=Vulgatibacter sp. TaxID=1971226 RepID=UPI003562AAEA
MVGVVVAAHGKMAEALVAAAEGIVGRLENLQVVNLLAHEGMECGQGKIVDAIKAVDTGSGVVVLADIFGGTPSNCCLQLLGAGQLEVVTGVNLPMLLRLATSRLEGQNPKQVAENLVQYGRQNITNASELLRSRCQVARG